MSLDICLEYEPCEHCGRGSSEAGSYNITHNLGIMAKEAGLYEVLWHPEDNGIVIAEQLIKPLEAGISAMVADPSRFEKFNAANGWGTYQDFVPWLEDLLTGCRRHPKCRVRVSR